MGLRIGAMPVCTKRPFGAFLHGAAERRRK